MSFVLWHHEGDARIASSRRVLRAAEVPLLRDAQALRDRLHYLLAEREEIVAAAAHQAHAQGHAQGLAEARTQAAEQLAATLTALVQTSAHERDRLRAELVTLALQVVRKLLGGIAEDAVLAALAVSAAHDLLGAQPVALAVHPDLSTLVRERLAASADGAVGLRCEVRADPGCARDSCRLETEHGSVDASLETQLARLETAWAATLS